MSELSRSDFETLVGAIYAAPLSDGGWQGFLDTLDAVLDGPYLSLYGHDLRTGNCTGMLTTRYAPEQLAAYRDHYATVNPFPAVLSRARPLDFRPSDGWLPRDVLVRSEFYDGFLRPQEDIGSGGGGVIANEEDRLVLFTAQVPFRLADSKTPELVAAMQCLAPHIRRAFDIDRALGAARLRGSAHAAMLDRVARPTFLLDGAARVLFANAAAERLLEEAAYVARRRDGTLAFADRGSQAAMRREVAACCRRAFDETRGAVAVLDEDGARLPALIGPVRMPADSRSGDGIGFGAPDCAVLTLPVPVASVAPGAEAALRAVYGVTPAEARVALAVGRGETLAEIAADAEVALSTVRNQLKSVYAKTGLRRQAEVAALVAGLV